MTSRYNELAEIAGENDGFVTSASAHGAGISSSILVRLAQRGRLERVSRGLYRIPYVPPGRLSRYREIVMWAQAHRGPAVVALSHQTALLVYGVSDASPRSMHLTVPRSARLRRQQPRGIVLHRSDLDEEDITVHEGLPLTSVPRTVRDLLDSRCRLDIIEQAITEARREGFIDPLEARRLRYLVRKRSRAS